MNIQNVDRNTLVSLQQSMLQKAMPPHSLGRLETLALNLGLITSKPLDSLSLLLFAGDHGVVEENVTHSRQEITYQQCRNFAHGGGACALFAKLNQVSFSVIDVGVNHSFQESDKVIDEKVAFGTKNFLKAPAMEKPLCLSAMQRGRQRVLREWEAGFDAIAFGEMGVGNTTSASAIAAKLLGLPVSLVTGKGSGLSDSELQHKISIIEQALELHQTNTPLDVLCTFGGYEMAAIAGGLLQAAELGLPILLDGFVVSSAALVACRMEPLLSKYLVPCHRSGMQGHDAILKALDCGSPLLDLGMQLGEGTGALAAWPLVRLASHILSDMTSFSDAKVTNSTEQLRSLGLV